MAKDQPFRIEATYTRISKRSCSRSWLPNNKWVTYTQSLPKAIHIFKNGGILMGYRIQLNMKTQEFIAIDPHNAKHIGKGETIEKALQQLKK